MTIRVLLLKFLIVLFSISAFGAVATAADNPRVGVGPVYTSEEDCNAGAGVYTPSQTAIARAEHNGTRTGLVAAFPAAQNNETVCVLMHTSVRTGPSGATKAVDGTKTGDFWVKVYTRYIMRRHDKGPYIYWLCVNDIYKISQPEEVAEVIQQPVMVRREAQPVVVPPLETSVTTPAPVRRQVRTQTTIDVYDDVTVIRHPGQQRVEVESQTITIPPTNVTILQTQAPQTVYQEPRGCVNGCWNGPRTNERIVQCEYPRGQDGRPEIWCVPISLCRGSSVPEEVRRYNIK